MKRSSFWGFFVVVLLLLMASGCQTLYRVNISGNPFVPFFEPEKPLYIGGGATIALSEFNPESNSTVRIWVMEFPVGTKGRFLSGVRYGEIPEGFTVLRPEKPLRADVIYVIHFNAGGGVHAAGYFKIAYQGATPTLIELKSAGADRNTRR